MFGIANMIRRRMRFLARSLKKPVPVLIPVFQSELLMGRRALITGGTSGIGFAIAKAFYSSGADVMITGRNQDRLDLAKSLIGNRCVTIILDNTRVEFFEKTVNQLGKFDILVNNAGYVGGGAFGNVTLEGYDKTLETNLRGPFMLSQTVSRKWIEDGVEGNILNICSASSLRPGDSPYILSKWGLRSLTQGMAKSLIKYGIVVNGLAPGCTDTRQFCSAPQNGIENPKNPAGRLVTVEEIANLAVVLVSTLSRMVVGEVLFVTGGGAIITKDCEFDD